LKQKRLKQKGVKQGVGVVLCQSSSFPKVYYSEHKGLPLDPVLG